MRSVNVHEAKTTFSRLLERVALGEDVVISRAGRPVARLVPIEGDAPGRTPGTARGQVWVARNFDSRVPPEDERAGP